MVNQSHLRYSPISGDGTHEIRHAANQFVDIAILGLDHADQGLVIRKAPRQSLR